MVRIMRQCPQCLAKYGVTVTNPTDEEIEKWEKIGDATLAQHLEDEHAHT